MNYRMAIKVIIFLLAFFVSEKIQLRANEPAPVRPELMLNLDVFDNLTEAQWYGDASYYGPRQIEELFERAEKHGITKIFWRAHSEIASYRSTLNYHLGEEFDIRSRPDARRRSGAFSAKIATGHSEGGISQKIETEKGKEYQASAWISAPEDNQAWVTVFNADNQQILAQSAKITNTGNDLAEASVHFKAPGPVRIAVRGASSGEKLNIFVVDDVSVIDANARELARNGDMEEPLHLLPALWEDDGTKFIVLNGDVRALPEDRRKQLFPIGTLNFFLNGRPRAENRQRALAAYDPLAEAVRQAKKRGIALYAWFDPLDYGRRMPPGCEGWKVSRFHEDHPEYRLVDQNGVRRWGMLCFGYPAVRAHALAVIDELLDYDVDGIYLKSGWNHCQNWDGHPYTYEQFAYNDVAKAEYDRRWGKPEDGHYLLNRLKVVQGDFFVDWVEEATERIRSRGKKLCLSARPGDQLEALVGGWHFDWRRIIGNRLVDEFLIELRITGPTSAWLKEFDNTSYIISRARAAGVRVGFDFYINNLRDPVVRKHGWAADAASFVGKEIAALGRLPIDFLGIYEGWVIDQRNFWKGVTAGHDALLKLQPSERLEPTPMPQTVHAAINSDPGLRATVTQDGKSIAAEEVFDGDLSDGNGLQMSGLPFEVIGNFPSPIPTRAIRLFPGNFSYAANTSGECGIRAYRLEAKVAGQWKEVANTKTAPTVQEAGAASNFSFCYTHELPETWNVESIRLTVQEGSDSGRRQNAAAQLPPAKRIIYLREIELLPPDHTGP